MPISGGGFSRNTSHPGPVIYTVLVNGVPYKNIPRILDVSISMQWNQHDMCFIRIELPRNRNPKNLTIWAEDTPIELVWGRAPDLNHWYGYVNQYEIAHNADSGTHAQQITYVCIGTSMVLNPDKTRAWQSVSPTYIAKQIAQENGFRCVTTPIPGLVLNWEQQAGCSDFDFLNTVANKWGFRFWCSGGTMYFVVPNIALVSHSSAQPPVFTCNKQFETQDTARDFTIMTGQNIPGTVVANRAIFTLDSVGKPVSAIQKPTTHPNSSRIIVKQDYAASSYQEALARVQAEASLSQYWVAGKAQLFGDTSIYPGKVINIQGTATPGNTDGNWLVSSVEHNMLNSGTTSTTQDKYIMNVELMRNTKSTIDLGYIQPIVPEFARCILNKNGQWASVNPGVIAQKTVALP